jgi:acyl-CoA thioesterase FadM
VRQLLTDVFFLLRARLRPAVGLFEPCAVPMRVWPHQLDVQRRLSNGYFAILGGLARWDLMVRNGGAKVITGRGWIVVVAAQTLRYRHSLTLGDRFIIESRFLGLHERDLVVEHRFVREDRTVATAVVRCRLLRRTGGGVPRPEILEAMPELETHDFVVPPP